VFAAHGELCLPCLKAERRGYGTQPSPTDDVPPWAKEGNWLTPPTNSGDS